MVKRFREYVECKKNSIHNFFTILFKNRYRTSSIKIALYPASLGGFPLAPAGSIIRQPGQPERKYDASKALLDKKSVQRRFL